MNKASNRSKGNLKGIHPNLIMLVSYALAISEQDFFVSEGVRSVSRQQELYAQGRTTSGAIVTNVDGVKKKSNHQVKSDGYGYAVDMYYVGWTNKDKSDDHRWNVLYKAFEIASKNLGIAISIGGKWKMRDMPHIELA
ncbi:MAG: M15 family metallopeptidase [Fusobacteriaceae bacterium]